MDKGYEAALATATLAALTPKKKEESSVGFRAGRA